MKIFIALISIFMACQVSASVQIDYQPLIVKKRTYEFDAPKPFGYTVVRFTGSVDDIEGIEIHTLGKTIIVPKEVYTSLFSVSYGDLEFIVKNEDIEESGEIKAFEFNLYYGAPQKVECTIGNFEYVQKAVKFIINSEGALTARDDNTYFQLCQEVTASEKKIN